MRGRRGAVPLALAVVSMGLAAAPASAVVSTIYVQSGSNCTNSGVGSSSAPFCTIQKAASVVQPGQTVMIGYGSYPETVTITAKGTASAPIRFVGQSVNGGSNNPLATWVGSNGGTTTGSHAFVLNGAQYVTVTGMAVSGTQEAVLVQNSKNVTLNALQTANQQGAVADVHVSGSSNVTISNSMLEYGALLDSGTSGTVLVSDLIEGSALNGIGGVYPAVRATDAAGTVVESDTINPGFCANGIDLEGASTGSVIANNIVDTAGTGTSAGTCTGQTGIVVASTAASGTTSDYNIVYTNGGPLYNWSGTNYADVASFTNATGQGTHDLSADPKLVIPTGNFTLISTPYYPTEGSPEIDSGDAAHAPATDANGMPRVDDPLVANTGSGIGYVDRGAYEYQDPIAMLPLTAKHVVGGSPLDTAITAGVSAAWSNQITYTYDFRDGTTATVTGGMSVTQAHDFTSAGYQFMSVSANDGFAATSQQDQNSYTSFVLGADYTPMNPTRMLDTRHAKGVTTTTPVPANSDVTLTVGGVDNIPTAGLSAVVMNVTVTQPTAGGYLTVYPHGSFLPRSSNLNFKAGQTVPNLVTTLVTDGKVVFHNGSGGTVHVIADVEGYYADSGYGYKSVSPVRVLDTRKPTGVPVKAPVPAGGHLSLDLSSQVPAGTKAVTMNVTVTGPKAGGYLTVYPDGTPAPIASNLNFSAGQTVPNLVTVPVDNGKVDFQNSSGGTVDVIADLAGYYGDATTGANAGLAPNTPYRIWDTRIYGPPTGPVAAGGTLHLHMNSIAIDSNTPPTPVGAVMNVTVTGPAAGGYLTVYPDGTSRPTASNVNFSAGQTVPNLVSVALGTDGVDIYNGGGKTNIVVDLEGLFVPPLS